MPSMSHTVSAHLGHEVLKPIFDHLRPAPVSTAAPSLSQHTNSNDDISPVGKRSMDSLSSERSSSASAPTSSSPTLGSSSSWWGKLVR